MATVSRRVPMSAALAVVAVAVGGGFVSAQHVYRTEVQLVQVAATVTDRDGRLITTLAKEDFIVHEDGTEQTVRVLARERMPVSLGILVDISDSMYGRRIADARSALDRFVLDLLAPSDEA